MASKIKQDGKTQRPDIEFMFRLQEALSPLFGFQLVNFLIDGRQCVRISGPVITTTCDSGNLHQCGFIQIGRGVAVVAKLILQSDLGAEAYGINFHPFFMGQLGGSQWRKAVGREGEGLHAGFLPEPRQNMIYSARSGAREGLVISDWPRPSAMEIARPSQCGAARPFLCSGNGVVKHR